MTHDEYLAHFGIKGMRWGIRKDKKTGKSKRSKKEDLSKYSDKELRERLNRLLMEKQYKQLTKKEKSAAEKIVGNALKSLIVPATAAISKKYLVKGVKTLAGLIGGKKGIDLGLSKLDIDFSEGW